MENKLGIDCVFVIPSNSKKSYQEWQNIVKNKHITASIDLYYFGLIFFRKEQAKEHFIIRA